MDEFVQDLRVGARQLVRRPGFALTAIGSLALGIGITTTLFTVVNAVLFKSSPLGEPARLVEIYSAQRGEDMQLTTSYLDLQSLRAGVPAFDALAAHAYVRGVLTTTATPLLVTGESVTANYFDVLGVPLALGRGFRPDEDATAGGAPVVVVSHGLWQRQFAARPDIVGATVKLSGLTYTVIGVTPERFPGTMPGLASDFWVPVTMVERFQFTGMQWTGEDDPGTTRLDRRSTRWLFVKGRLADGQTIAQARAQAEAVFAQLAADYPRTNEKAVVTLVPAANIRFHPMVDGYVRAASAGLLGAVGLVLLIACANVAAMLLARGSARRREMAVRAAIGAGRGRLVRQLLSEGLVLALVGGVAGVLLAAWAGRFIGAFAATALPIQTTFDFSLDRTVLLFAAVVSVLTALVFGLAPAWSASRPDLVPALKDTLDGGGSTRRRVTLRDALVVGQLALSLVLLVSGALLARGLVVARATDLGFDPSRIAGLSFSPQMNGYDADRTTALAARVLEAARAVPGVTAAALSTRLPLGPDINMNSFAVPGHHDADDDGTSVDTTYVGADYFAVMGVPLVEGRAFTEDEALNDRPVIIVNETFAKTYWPGQSAVGRVVHSGGLERPPLQIVGVSRDHKVRSAGEAPMPYAHMPIGKSRSIRPGRAHGRPGRRRGDRAQAGGVGARTRRGVHVRRRGDRIGRGHARPDAHRRRPHRGGRRAGAAAGRGRALRRHRLFGEPAHARSGHPHGARRRARSGAAHGARPGHATRARRRGPRRGAGRRRCQCAAVDALRRECDRSARLAGAAALLLLRGARRESRAGGHGLAVAPATAIRG